VTESILSIGRALRAEKRAGVPDAQPEIKKAARLKCRIAPALSPEKTAESALRLADWTHNAGARA